MLFKSKKLNNEELKEFKKLRKTKDYFCWTCFENGTLSKNTSGIYAIYLPVKSKDIKETIPVYIGQSIDIKTRWQQHQKQLLKTNINDNKRTYVKMITFAKTHKKDIFDYRFVILETTSKNKKKLDIAEKKYIELYGSFNYGFNNTGGNY